ncbi:hypothetical protein BC827DRAFT_1193772 [Russula dissimulans]|nr:hypothetical protein BC827DRAFT_1193772 [Russula dissimulans]
MHAFHVHVLHLCAAHRICTCLSVPTNQLKRKKKRVGGVSYCMYAYDVASGRSCSHARAFKSAERDDNILRRIVPDRARTVDRERTKQRQMGKQDNHVPPPTCLLASERGPTTFVLCDCATLALVGLAIRVQVR